MILDEIEKRGHSQALLISNFMERNVMQAHAYTVKLLPDGWVLLDSFFPKPLYQNPSIGQQNIKSFFGKVIGSDVYVLTPDEMSEEDFQKRFDKLRRVMT